MCISFVLIVFAYLTPNISSQNVVLMMQNM